ncbi:MAG: transglycosylase SLT domain-containing protein [Candidatus Electrothrix sp. GW3-4]|uniref:transglycosylase SLT domain-containing protein n=1 Tax=Candidatus Electrothrix sp. GW3-4 TaxID=3126740 RepID=UPI0030CE96F3
MKVSLFVPLVSLPFFAACSPALHNTDLLKNINQEEFAISSFSAEKNRESPQDVHPEKKIVFPGGPEKTAENDRKTDERGLSQALVVYSSELVPIVGEEREGVAKNNSENNRLASLRPSSKYRERNADKSMFSLVEISGYGEQEQELEDVPPLYTPVQSEQELKEELTALEKTGDWSDSGEGKQDVLSSYGIQCDLPKSFAPVQLNLNINFLSSVAKGKGDVQPEQLDPSRKSACDFPVIINKQVEFYLDQFQNRQRTTFRQWLQRSAIYLPVIEKELKKAALPQSLAYLAMIESGFNPVAYSPARASGLWQFITSTARHYGLRIDSWLDERRDPEKATQAAVAYLDALYKRFGDWQLAVAAYNAGEGKIQRGLVKYKAKNFWDLAAKDYLPLETKRYVPKLIAAIIIAHDPERYGFESVRVKKAQYDVVDVPSRTSLSAIAAAGGCSVKKIRQLNNELLKNQVPPTKGMYSIKVPAGSSTRIAANLDHIRADEERKIVHRLRKGETLSGIGKRYNVSVDMIMQWNDIDDVRRIRAGRKIALYPSGKADTGADKSEDNITVSYYKVRNGDSLWSIARKHQVSTQEIKRWNRLSNNLLHPGKKLVIKKS